MERVAKSKIYTKTGDRGATSLYTGERLSKTNPVFDALGNTDELNSSLGLAAAACSEDSQIMNIIFTIQNRLMDIGACIATFQSSEDTDKLLKTRFDPSHISVLENWIDILDAALPKLTNFILPSGGEASSRLHMSRSICRRAERSLAALLERQEIDENVFVYINRLSDLLFVMARTMAYRQGKGEVIYQKQ
ncbi:unnamed protein product [Blepharisma stoltei]|uniref:Corrinoid adenosyltransferase MMAB n=1 Tax=Blepharisma stoltei TaxID=1481888 RepID=A0AAU9ID82_9CILI|nr:unnamed protein product [Blepharisma stoltei]